MIIIMISNRSDKCDAELCETRERTIDVDKIEQETISKCEKNKNKKRAFLINYPNS